MIRTLNIKKLLLLTLISIGVVYYILFPISKIIDMLKDEYIVLSICVVLFAAILYYKQKLKGLQIVPYLVNTEVVPLKSTLAIFFVLQGVDYYYEDGFIGMVSLWFTYWSFALLAYLLTNVINLYKNFKFYKYESINEYRL